MPAAQLPLVIDNLFVTYQLLLSLLPHFFKGESLRYTRQIPLGLHREDYILRDLTMDLDEDSEEEDEEEEEEEDEEEEEVEEVVYILLLL